MGRDYIKKILLVGSSGKRDNEWGMCCQGRPRGGGQGAVAPPWKLAGIYFLVHKIFVS